jgi:RNA polymerase sigma factor (sigma-70 family)
MFSHGAEGLSDGQLLSRFADERDEAAFAALIRRHGHMVLGVCRRVLGNLTDAEDAFQASFLVLATKARSLAHRQVVGDWLHGVARRTALKARSATARRRVVERAAARSEVQDPIPRNDWLPRLDQEIVRLPERYRLPIVLCDLEGKTRLQAAKQLGWPEGTVAGRLARGRELLAKRLLRGALLVSGALPGMLAGGAVKGALPFGLVHSTVRAAALGSAATNGVLSANAAALAKGVMQAMFWNKTKVAGLAFVATVVFAGVGGRAVQILAVGANQARPEAGAAVFSKSQLSKEKVQKDAKPAETEEDKRAKELAQEILKLTQELVKAAENQWLGRWNEYIAGKTTVDFLLSASADLRHAQLRLANDKEQRIKVYEAELERMQTTESISKTKYDAGAIPTTQYEQVKYARIEAEIMLLETRQGTPPEGHKAKKLDQFPLAENLTAKSPVNSRAAAFKEQFHARWREYLLGQTTVDFLLTASQQLMHAELYAAKTKEEKVAICQYHIDKMDDLRVTCRGKYELGQIPVTQYAPVRAQLEDFKATLKQVESGK